MTASGRRRALFTRLSDTSFSMSVKRHLRMLLAACLAVGLVAVAVTGATLANAAPTKRAADVRLTASPLAFALPPAHGTSAKRPGPLHPVRGAVTYGEGDARFGASRGGRMHEGQDIFAPEGTTLVAVRDGVVLEAGGGDERGNYVAIYSPAARETYVYLHMQDEAGVRPGGHVHAGQAVGRLGCTGSCFGAHLHFEVRRGRGVRAAPQDPLPLLQRWHRA
jgi:murein DD-endopeptidase MepM/ murein hydrolase activator NlpD